MMMRFAACAALALLTGCAQSEAPQVRLAGLLNGAMAGMSGGRQAPETRTVVTVVPPGGEAVAAARLSASIPSRRATATLAIEAINGTVTTWRTADNITLSFDNRVLVSTRGLGFDLMGAGAAKTRAALAGGDPGSYQRQLRYLDGENHTFYITAACTMQSRGTETVNGRRLQRWDEQCESFHDKFTNVFWRDGQGRVLRSRQWIGPEIGYLETSWAN